MFFPLHKHASLTISQSNKNLKIQVEFYDERETEFTENLKIIAI